MCQTRGRAIRTTYPSEDIPGNHYCEFLLKWPLFKYCFLLKKRPFQSKFAVNQVKLWWGSHGGLKRVRETDVPLALPIRNELSSEKAWWQHMCGR